MKSEVHSVIFGTFIFLMAIFAAVFAATIGKIANNLIDVILTLMIAAWIVRTFWRKKKRDGGGN